MPWTERSQRISAFHQLLTGTLSNDLEIVGLRLLRERTDPAELRDAVEGLLAFFHHTQHHGG